MDTASAAASAAARANRATARWAVPAGRATVDWGWGSIGGPSTRPAIFGVCFLDLGTSTVLCLLSDVGELRNIALGNVANGALEVAVGFLESKEQVVVSPAWEQLLQRGQLRGMLFLQVGEFAHDVMDG
jgi:hypothetical protein